MNVREAEIEDVIPIQEVALESWKDTYSEILSEDTIREVIEDWYSAQDLEQQIDDPVFYVAEKDGEVIGFVHATVKDRKASLHRIYLKPEYQSQGIGSNLYDKAENELKCRADTVELEVLADNETGRNFYLHKGFEEQKTEEIGLKGEKVNQKILIKELD
jgi:ribosomal protein S18 acetylase RimI-like enzyme